MKSRGSLVVLEGLDGSGKTRVAQKLVKDLNECGYRALYTYEPYASLYVDILKRDYGSYRDAYLDALTFAADRIIHVKTVIAPSLERGEIVVCDRYYYSSIAYQSAQGAPYDWIVNVNKYMPKPDVAIYLDVDPLIGLARKRGLESRFPEYEDLGFLNRVRERYHRLVAEGYLEMVDANRDFELVYGDVVKLVSKALNLKLS